MSARENKSAIGKSPRYQVGWQGLPWLSGRMTKQFPGFKNSLLFSLFSGNSFTLWSGT